MDYNTNNTPENNIEEFIKAQNRAMRMRFISGMLVGFMCTILIISGAAFYYLSSRKVTLTDENIKPVENSVMDLETTDKVEALESLIENYYYKDDIDKETKRAGIYKGLMNSLGDPYSVYYTAEELEDFMSDTQGIYYGIGAYVSFDSSINYPRITEPMPGSPAEEAGLCPEDIIFAVDDVSTQGMDLEDVVALIKGEEGTSVHLTLVRNGYPDNIEVDVIRASVEVPTVTTKVLEDDIGYLKITEFDEVTANQFTEGLADLRSQNIKGLIIDLRNNPGGSLNTVCDIARQLLPKGVIVYTLDKEGNREDYNCEVDNKIDIPVVVLVNKYSASASEILSGAIKDYKLGKLVGTTTYGKGIVQRVFDLRDGTAIKLTVSSYYTPSGVNIHGIGIEPDVTVEFDADAYIADKTDNQLDKAVEVMKGLLDK